MHCRVMLLLLLAATAQTVVWNWDDLIVTYNNDGDKGYYQLPLLYADAIRQGWSQPPEVINLHYNFLCPDHDPTVCVIYHKGSGKCNGVQIGIQRNDTKGPYDFSDHHVFEPTTRFGYEIYLITMYTVKPGTNDVSSSNEKTLYIQTGPDHRSLCKIPTNKCEIEKTPFVFEHCLPATGDHYYYNMSKNLSCMDFEPMVALFTDTTLIGFAIQTFGRAENKVSKKWFEALESDKIKTALPDSPDCLTDWTAEYGLMSIHVFFVHRPWERITCNH